MYVNCKKIPKH